MFMFYTKYIWTCQLLLRVSLSHLCLLGLNSFHSNFFNSQRNPAKRHFVMILLSSSFSSFPSSSFITVALAMASVVSSNVSPNNYCPKECLCLSQIQVCWTLGIIYILQLYVSSSLISPQPRKDHLCVFVALVWVEGACVCKYVAPACVCLMGLPP